MPNVGYIKFKINLIDNAVCSATYVLLYMYCYICTATYVLLHMYCYICTATHDNKYNDCTPPVLNIKFLNGNIE